MQKVFVDHSTKRENEWEMSGHLPDLGLIVAS